MPRTLITREQVRNSKISLISGSGQKLRQVAVLMVMCSFSSPCFYVSSLLDPNQWTELSIWYFFIRGGCRQGGGGIVYALLKNAEAESYAPLAWSK
jgi:hypothetical protein